MSRIEINPGPWHAISIRQPWAEWIVNVQVGKNIENRTLKSVAAVHIACRLKELRRPFDILIHAGKHNTKPYNAGALQFAMDHLLLPDITDPEWTPPTDLAELPRGGIVGVATVRGLQTPDALYGQMPDDMGWWDGSECRIHLTNPRRLAFVECKGRQHLFHVPADVVNQIRQNEGGAI